MHDGYPVGHFRDDAKVVCDEEERKVELGTQVAQQVEHLGLDRDVEGRGGFIGDDQRRMTRERDRDHDPLSHPS